MANIYLKKSLYDELIRLGITPSDLINELVKKHLEEIKTARATVDASNSIKT